MHHGDIIPFIKEVIEILFSQGLIKVLFATETFAMGINMPTKTGESSLSSSSLQFLTGMFDLVIFYSLKKFDSVELRMLNSSEYTQMSGRAGRRGLDLKGNVIIFVPDVKKLPMKSDLKKMMDHKVITHLPSFSPPPRRSGRDASVEVQGRLRVDIEASLFPFN